MKVIIELCAVLFIHLVECGYPDPTTHKNWYLLNQNDCGYSVAHRQSSSTNVRSTNGQFPWVVLIHIKDPDSICNFGPIKCMGSIITDRHILTASSCFERYGSDEVPAGAVFARTGELDRSYPGCDNPEDVCAPKFLEYKIAKTAYYKNNNPAKDGDNIALLTTEEAMFFNYFVKPVCLEYGELLDKNYGGEHGTKVFGWGQREDPFVYETVEKLRQAHVQILTDEENNAVFDEGPEAFELESNRESSFCVGQTLGETWRKADTGGPFMVEASVGEDKARRYLVGILSFEVHDVILHELGVPHVCTKVKYYLQWILDQIDPDLLPA